MRKILIRLLTFDAKFFCLYAAQNATPAGGQPAGGAFCAANRRKLCIKSKQAHFGLNDKFQGNSTGSKGLSDEPASLLNPNRNQLKLIDSAEARLPFN